MVESLMPGRSTCCAQPASMMTRARRSSSVAAVPGPSNFGEGGSTAGASSIMAAIWSRPKRRSVLSHGRPSGASFSARRKRSG